MSISSTLSNALSGLSASSRSAEIVSSNIANALTDGYGVRSLQTSARVTGGMGAGVQIDGVLRDVDQRLLNDRRGVEAELGKDTTISTFIANVEAMIGAPDDESSLARRIARLESGLIEASSRPDSPSRLDTVVMNADGLAKSINSMAGQVQDMRLQADKSIAEQVDALNRGLANVAELNERILGFVTSGRDASSLMDQRQKAIDQIAEIVPLKEVNRPNGRIALYTPGGALLLDGRAATVAFTGVNLITEDMTLASGALSGLSINGQPISTGPKGQLAGGSLEAMFTVRDVLGTQAQDRLDAVARDLIERFQDPALDPTRAPGDPGLFTDNGAAFNPVNERGLASRLEINALVDPARGGASWRLRDGLGAAGPGDVGNATLLNALGGALSNGRVAASGNFSFASRSSSGVVADLLSKVAAEGRNAEFSRSFKQASLDTLRQAEFAQGVDSDAEMERLLLVEQAYAANARVISVADDMIQILLGL